MATRRKVMRHRRAVEKAADLYVQFRGENPEFINTVKMDVPPVMLLIGECDGVLYTTRRDGHIEKYIHEFAKTARPLLCSSYDGQQLFLIGGRYNFTDAGIVDR
jgi:hypothetical protein